MLLHFIAIVVLSRLLDAEDFGMVAMVQSVVAFGEIIRDAGFSTATLQQRTLSDQLASNLFWLNVAMSTAVTAIIISSTPLIVTLFEEPRLWLITPALALSILIHGVGAQIRVQLARRLQFGRLASSSVISQLLSVSVAIIFATLGLGYWALVAQILTGALTLLLIQWLFLDWVPLRFRRGHGTRRLVVVGLHYFLNQLISFLQGNGSTIVIGRAFGANSLGEYNRASQLATFATGGVLGPLMRVVLPTLNQMSELGRPVGPVLLRIEVAVGVTFTAALASLAGAANGVIPLLLGPGWNQTIWLFRILAIAASVDSLYYVCSWAFMHYGLSRQLLFFNCVARPLALLLVVVGAQFGLLGAAIGYLSGVIIAWPMHFLWLRRQCGLNWVSMLIRGLLIIVLGLICATVGFYAWLSMSTLDDFARTCISLLAGFLSYFVGVLSFRTLRNDIIWLLRRAMPLFRRS